MAINEEMLKDRFPATAGELAEELKNQGAEREASIMDQLPPDAMFESLDELKDRVREIDEGEVSSDYNEAA